MASFERITDSGRILAMSQNTYRRDRWLRESDWVALKSIGLIWVA